MSRYSQQANKSSLIARGKTAAIDFARSGDSSRSNPTSTTKGQRHPAPTPAQMIPVGEQSGSASESGSAGDADGDQDDGGEADGENEDAGEPNVNAPSDRNSVSKENQAGLDPRCKNTQPTYDETLTEAGEAESDEEDYNGVDLISESEDEGPAMESIEERAIIDSEEDHADPSQPLSPPNSPFSLTSVDLDTLVYGKNPFLTDEPFFEAQMGRLDPEECANDTQYHGSASSFRFASPLTEPPQRRVRFADPLMLPSEDETSLFPDFNDPGALETMYGGPSSGFRRVRARLTNDDLHSWDDNAPICHPEADGTAAKQSNMSSHETDEPSNVDDEAGSEASLSGYESGSLPT